MASFLPFFEHSGNLIHVLDQFIVKFEDEIEIHTFFLVNMFRRKMALCLELY